jgi:hypothetical protein
VSQPPTDPPSEPDPARDGAYPAHYPPGQAPITPWNPGRGAEPSRGHALGVWAFGLALLPFVITNMVSLALAAVTLVKSRDGRNHGTGFAIIAIVIDLLVVPAWALVIILLAL